MPLAHPARILIIIHSYFILILSSPLSSPLFLIHAPQALYLSFRWTHLRRRGRSRRRLTRIRRGLDISLNDAVDVAHGQCCLERQVAARVTNIDRLWRSGDVPVLCSWVPVGDVTAGNLGFEGGRGAGGDVDTVEVAEDADWIVGT